jgi:CubicO group peptidase (beta-lactamase class C family)
MPSMSDLKVEAEAAEVGLDASRLARAGGYFRGYVDDERMAGWSLVVGRGGQVAYLEAYGHSDVEAGAPVEPNTLFRIMSMTKPVTAVAAMICVERGLFGLKDPVSRFIPSFGEARVFTGGTVEAPETEALSEPMRIWHLLTHTAGLVYDWVGDTPPYELFTRAQALLPKGADLAVLTDTWGKVPLLFQPGSSWHYSVASDALGRVVEVASGQPLDVFFAEQIFAPLGMLDTHWYLEGADLGRLARLYQLDAETNKATALPREDGAAGERPAFFSGGGDGGLISTLGDYYRFAEMMRRRGELDGVRFLGARTVDFMTSNHLPGNSDIAHFGKSWDPGDPLAGMGYGLGVGVWVDPVAAKVPWNPASYWWGGAYNTYFWVDPVKDMTVVFMTQLIPLDMARFVPRLVQLVNQSIID